jgi:hypothetical protein
MHGLVLLVQVYFESSKHPCTYLHAFPSAFESSENPCTYLHAF